MLVKLDENLWVDPAEVVGVEDGGSLGYVNVYLRGGVHCQTDCKVGEVIEILEKAAKSMMGPAVPGHYSKVER